MQAAHAPNRFNSRPQIKMIGIGEKNLDAEFFEYILRDTLDGSESSHWHEDGSLDGSVRSDELASAGGAAASGAAAANFAGEAPTEAAEACAGTGAGGTAGESY